MRPARRWPVPEPGVFPATPGEWAAAALRYLVNARMLHASLTPETLRDVHQGIERAAALVRYHDDGAEILGVELADLYKLMVALERIFTALGAERAREGASLLRRSYTEIVPVGGGPLPHSPLGESRL